jgi:hypothetical protein
VVAAQARQLAHRQRADAATEAIMRVRAAFAAAGVVSLTLSVAAHHSHGQYDETFQDIEGVVKELHLLTPHSWLYIEVTDAKGAPELWALEATTRAQLEGIGVTRDFAQARRRHQGALSSAARQEQRVPPGISEDQGRNGQGLGWRERHHRPRTSSTTS